MEHATTNKQISIAFPAVGTGGLHYPPQMVVCAFKRAIEDAGVKNMKLKVDYCYYVRFLFFLSYFTVKIYTRAFPRLTCFHNFAKVFDYIEASYYKLTEIRIIGGSQ